MHQAIYYLGVSASLVLSISTTASAQLPNPNPPRPPEDTLPSDVPEPLDPPLDSDIPRDRPIYPNSSDGEALELEISGFEFMGSTVFDEEDFTQLNNALEGRLLGVPIDFNQLLEIEAIVEQLYLAGCDVSTPTTDENLASTPQLYLEETLQQLNPDGCYLNSGAVLVAGDGFNLETGIVPVQIIEGRVADSDLSVDIEGLRENYIRDRLQPSLQPLDRNALLEALQILQLDPRIEAISAQLSEAGQPGRAALNLIVSVDDALKTRLFTDNGRAPTVGTFRRGIEITDNSLLNLGDRFNLSYANTAGSHAVNGSYTLPLNSHNGTLRLSGGFTDTEVIEEPFDRVDITGDSHFVELSLRQPVVLTPSTEFALGLTASRQDSESTLLGEPFPLSAGASEEGETRISALRFFQDYTRRNQRDVFALRSQFSLGLGALNATVNNERPDSEFFAWRGQAQYVRQLSQEALLFLRGDVQLANDTLMPLERFGIGGFRSVRGYRQDSLLTDNGLFFSAEVQIPVLEVTAISGELNIAPFLDVGVGWNHENGEEVNQTQLVGLGLGLQWQIRDRLFVRLDWGIPLLDIESSDETLQENGLYFSIEYNPF